MSGATDKIREKDLWRLAEVATAWLPYHLTEMPSVKAYGRSSRVLGMEIQDVEESVQARLEARVRMTVVVVREILDAATRRC